ncbi:MAG TPA: YciI family protein [Verrucomicrobiae bacterium]|nr:YciI family protein [Verrucomicrobiae bacterium]
MKYVLLYDSAPDVRAKAPAHFPAHRARMQEFHWRGTLLMAGPFGNPEREGSMAVFTTREAAEEFAQGDPFVVHGVVARWHVREWNEVLS